MAKTGPALSRWHHLVENFNTSSTEFYSEVEEAIRRREVPEVSISRVDWKEGGLLTAEREYLRVTRGTLIFDICAAPFGNGFFFSWWLAKAQFLWGILLFLFVVFGVVPMALFIGSTVAMKILGILGGAFVFFLGIGLGAPLVLYGFISFMNQQAPGWDDPIMALPFIGPVYQVLFRPATYYSLDTAIMFQEAVHHAVLEVMERRTSAKGLRALSELERKPVMREFFTR